MDKVGGLDENGKYKSLVKTNDQRFGIHMSPLSTGRSLFTHASLAMSTPAIAIALRYTTERRQFSSSP